MTKAWQIHGCALASCCLPFSPCKKKNKTVYQEEFHMPWNQLWRDWGWFMDRSCSACWFFPSFLIAFLLGFMLWKCMMLSIGPEPRSILYCKMQSLILSSLGRIEDVLLHVLHPQLQSRTGPSHHIDPSETTNCSLDWIGSLIHLIWYLMHQLKIIIVLL